MASLSSLQPKKIWPAPHLGCSPLSRYPLYDGCILHRAPHPTVGVECVKGAQVGKGHQDYGNCFVDHHGRGGIGQAAEDGGKVPHTAQQGARCAAHQHQGLRKEESGHGGKRVEHTLSQQFREK